MRNELKKSFIAAFPNTIPIFTGFIVLGIAYGILMQTKGYGPLWSLLISALCFCGSMQFVAITLLTSTFSPLHAFLLSIIVNARHLFYGISMLSKYKGTGKLKGFLIFWLCDETFSVSSSIEPPEGVTPKYFYFFISLLDYSYWVLGSVLGGLIGKLFTFDTKGLDFVLTALFVVLFLEQWKKPENRIACIIGICATLIGLFITGPDALVIPSMILILIVLITGREKICS